MRISKEPDERKQEILDAAIRVFVRKGYDRTSISDIAKEIGISQGLCYRYFPSKEAMYDEAINEYADYIVAQKNSKAIKQSKTLKEHILLVSGITRGFTNKEQGKSDLYDLFHKEGNQKLHDELLLKVGERLVPHVAEEIREANQRGETSITDPEATAYFCVFGQIGVLLSNTIPEEEKTKRIQDSLIELMKL